MATTIRVYIDGGGTPAATGTMAADRTFSVPVAGVPDGTHTFEITAQEDGKGESGRVFLLTPGGSSSIVVAHGTTQHPLVGDATGTATLVGDLAAPGAPTPHPLAGDVVGTGSASADLTAPKLHPLAGDVTGTGAAVADLTAPGPVGGSALIPGNPSFESALAGAETDGNWWPYVSSDYYETPPTFGAERYASASMAGNYVGRVFLSDAGDAGNVTAALRCRFAASAIDAAQTITFDVRRASGTGSLILNVLAYDSGGAALLNAATGKDALYLLGSAGYPLDADASLTTAAPTNGQTYTKTFDLKAWISGRLNAGKTWSDVSKVIIGVHVWNQYGDFYVDNFR
jgi:hypothetical protein